MYLKLATARVTEARAQSGVAKSALFPSVGATASASGPKQLVDSIRTVRKNTILIAEDIPEKDYGYRPTPDSRSVIFGSPDSDQRNCGKTTCLAAKLRFWDPITRSAWSRP
jgi:hypothetical protein